MISQQIRADPLALGAEYQLGDHRATYKALTTCQIVVLAIVIAIGGIWTIISLAFAVVLGGFLPLIFMLVGLLFVGIAVFGIVRTNRNSAIRVYAYDGGLIHVGRESMQIIRWQDVQAVWHNVIVSVASTGSSTTTSVRHIYTVSCTDGTTLTLDQHFAKVRKLGKTIEVETARYLFPAALNTYQTYQTIAFGPLVITPQGLSHGSDMLPWSEVKSITINENNGQVVIRKQGKVFHWASVKLVEVPNVEVFRMLVHQITGVWP